jgi:hypothetical protein
MMDLSWSADNNARSQKVSPASGEIMQAPLIAFAIAVLGGLLLALSAFLGVTAAANWTILGAEICLVVATIVFLGWFVKGCVEEIRNA